MFTSPILQCIQVKWSLVLGLGNEGRGLSFLTRLWGDTGPLSTLPGALSRALNFRNCSYLVTRSKQVSPPDPNPNLTSPGQLRTPQTLVSRLVCGVRQGSPCRRKHAMLGPSASWRWRPVNLSLENDSKSPRGEGGVYLGNSDRQGPPDSGGPELACLSCVSFKASWVGFSDCSFKHPLHQPSRNRGLQENWQLFWGQWVVVLVTEEGEGEGGNHVPSRPHTG